MPYLNTEHSTDLSKSATEPTTENTKSHESIHIWHSDTKVGNTQQDVLDVLHTCFCVWSSPSPSSAYRRQPCSEIVPTTPAETRASHTPEMAASVDQWT